MTIVRSSRVTLLLTLCWVLAVTLGGLRAAETPDDIYFGIYSRVASADALKAGGKREEALKEYRQAYAALQELKKTHPTWNTKVVATRMSAVADSINALSAPPPEPSAPMASGTSGASAVGRETVTLLSNGVEPRQTLRFQPRSGSTQHWTLTTTMAMQMQNGDTPAQAIKIPPTKMTLETVIQSVDQNGDIHYENAFKDVSVEQGAGADAQAAAIQQSLEGMKGISISGIYSHRGIARSQKVRAGNSTNPQISQTLEQMQDTFSQLAVPLPEDAVGVGARWEHKDTLRSQGMKILQAATYELTSVSNGLVSLNVTISQNAANQKVQNPALPAVKLDLTRMEGSGAGTTIMTLDQLISTASAMKVHTDVAMAMNMNGQKHAIVMKMDIDLKMESQPTSK
jgi:hypothetical protein